MNNKKYFSSGEFAKLIGINKRTLHYYNDIDLFKPEIITDNGYHYYSIHQFAKLELILTLRKVGLSIEEINNYLTYTTDQSYMDMLEEKKKLINTYIKQLQSIQNFLSQKQQHANLSQKAKHGHIQCITLNKQKILLSKKITGNYDEHDFSIAADFSNQLKKQFHLYNNFGSRIKISNILNHNFNNYDSYYAYCPKETKYYDDILPKGKYIEAFCIGPWDLLPDIYKQILIFAKQHQLELYGYAYEEGLNEMTIDSFDQYITRILIPVK